MWLASPAMAAQDGQDQTHNKRWLRPARSYIMGRATKDPPDIAIILPRVISSKAYTLETSTCNEEDTEDRGDGDERPTYSLTLTNSGKKSGTVTHGDGTTYEIVSGGSTQLVPGDSLTICEGCTVHFIFQRVVVYLAGLRGDLQSAKQQLTTLGVRWAHAKASNGQGCGPQPYQTHILQPSFKSSLLSAYFAQHQAYFVSPAWLEAVIASSTYDASASRVEPRQVGKDYSVEWSNWKSRTRSSDARWEGLSDLELDFDALPFEGESKYFPAVGPGELYGQADRWAPHADRGKVFKDLFVVQFEDSPHRPMAENVVVAGGGSFACYDLRLHPDKTPSACAAELEAEGLVGGREPVLLKIRNEDEYAQHEATVDSIARRSKVANYKTLADVIHAVYSIDASSLKDADVAGTEGFVVGEAAVVAPPPASSPRAPMQADEAEPVAGPSGSRATLLASGSGERTGVLVLETAEQGSAAAEQADREAMPPPPMPGKRKLTRRAKTRNDDDMLDDILGISASAMAESSAARGGTYAASVPMDTDTSPYEPPAPSAHRSRLKRRVNTVASADPEPSQAEPWASRQTQRTRFQSPEVDESEIGRAARRQPVARETMSSMADSSQDASQEALALGAKRNPDSAGDKEAESRKRRRRELDDEDEEGQEHETPVPVKNKSRGKPGPPVDEPDAAAAPSGKFLAVTTGRKRVTESERQFNDEFNKLQLARPATAGLLTMPKVESHRLKWNERDLDAEELKQLDDWTSDISGKSLFRVKFVDFEKKPKVLPSVYVDEGQGTWAGMPNFKRFRPKTAAQAPARRERPAITLELTDTTDFGLNEVYKKKGKSRVALVEAQSQSQDSSETVRSTAAKSKAKSRARSTTINFADDDDASEGSEMVVDSALLGKSKPPKPSQARKAKPQQRTIEETPVDELEFDSPRPPPPSRSAKSRAASSMVQKQRRKAVTIDDGSDDDDGAFTFKGFSKAPTAAGKKRKR